MAKKIVVFIVFSMLKIALFGQTPLVKEQIKALNTYVDYTNECLHGMLIAHRLFENYNQDINKYVDLPGHQLNFYNNSDLPLNIFEDPDHWFYEVSPEDLFEKTKRNNTVLPKKILFPLLENTSGVHRITVSLNKLRLEIGDFINQHDLNVIDSLNHVYELLEKAVDLYDLAFAQTINLEDHIQSTAKELLPDSPERGFISLTQILLEIHGSSQQILFAVKYGDFDKLTTKTNTLKKATQRFESYSVTSENGFASKKYIRARKKIIQNARLIIATVDEFINKPEVPEDYALYEKNYYYYNSKIINKINRYGNGVVPFINQIIDLLYLPVVHRLECPHYLKIIYPNKLEKPIRLVKSSKSEIVQTPLTLMDRRVVFDTEKHEIWVDSDEPILEIFDHLLQDGDIVSINFNGDWIFENLSLETKPKKFKLKLNRTGKNYLILHAINEGKKPPNTIGINYFHKGRKKRFILQSNLKTSQLVEIKIDD